MYPPPMTSRPCVIIGAGISGLAAAQALRQQGVSSILLEKSRGVGGRLATRRIAVADRTGVADHGAQFFTVRDTTFATQVSRWRSEAAVDVWYDPDELRYCGRGGMTAPAKSLARSLDVRLGTRAQAVQARDDGWTVICEDGFRIEGDALLLTAPVPQSLALLDAGAVQLPPAAHSALSAIEYEPCAAAMLVLDGPSRIPPPGVLAGEDLDPRLLWIADNQQKGVSPDAVTLTLHASPAFTLERWDESAEDLAREMISAAGDRLGAAVLAAQVHRWRYARPTRAYPVPSLDPTLSPPLAFAGDAFAGARVEDAYRSGLSAAEKLLARLSFIRR